MAILRSRRIKGGGRERGRKSGGKKGRKKGGGGLGERVPLRPPISPFFFSFTSPPPLPPLCACYAGYFMAKYMPCLDMNSTYHFWAHAFTWVLHRSIRWFSLWSARPFGKEKFGCCECCITVTWLDQFQVRPSSPREFVGHLSFDFKIVANAPRWDQLTRTNALYGGAFERVQMTNLWNKKTIIAHKLIRLMYFYRICNSSNRFLTTKTATFYVPCTFFFLSSLVCKQLCKPEEGWYGQPKYCLS